MPVIGVGIGVPFIKSSGSGGGVSYEPESSDLFTRMAAVGTEPDETRKLLINDWFVGMKQDHSLTLGVSNINTLFDCLWILAGHAALSSRLNWIKDAHNLTTSAAPTWSTTGTTPNGTTQFFNTNFIPSTDGVTYLGDNACMGVWSLTNNDGFKIDLGCTVVGAFAQTDLKEGGSTYVFVNDAGGAVGTVVANSTGLMSYRRISTTQVEVWKGGVLLATLNKNFAFRPNINMYIHARNNAGTADIFSNRKLCMAYCGGILLNQAAFYTRTLTLLTGMGV